MTIGRGRRIAATSYLPNSANNARYRRLLLFLEAYCIHIRPSTLVFPMHFQSATRCGYVPHACGAPVLSALICLAETARKNFLHRSLSNCPPGTARETVGTDTSTWRRSEAPTSSSELMRVSLVKQLAYRPDTQADRRHRRQRLTGHATKYETA